MPCDGSMILSDARRPALAGMRKPCGRRGRYNVEGLSAQFGPAAKLSRLLQTLA
jgi:hypothetical protein